MTVYTEYTRDRNAVMFGLPWSHLLVCVAACIAFLVSLSTFNLVNIASTTLIASTIICLFIFPMRGRSIAGWTHTKFAFYRARRQKTSQWQSQAAAGNNTLENVEKVDLPGELSALEIHAGNHVSPDDRRLGMFFNKATRNWTIVARVDHCGLAMATAKQRAHFGTGMSDFLSGLATGGIFNSVSFTLWSTPDASDERSQWIRANLPDSAPDAARQVFLQAEQQIGCISTRSYAFVAFTCPEGTLRRKARDLGPGTRFLAAAMRNHAEEARTQLLGTLGCETVQWMDTDGLAAVIAAGYNPDQVRLLDSGDIIPAGVAGPAFAVPEARCYRHGKWATAAAAVVLPQKGVALGALAPILAVSTPDNTGGALERRSVTVSFQLCSRRKSQAAAKRRTDMNDLVSGIAAKIGSNPSHADHIQRGADDRMADATARGIPLVKGTCIAATTVIDPEVIPAASAALGASITAAGLVPQTLDMAHDKAFNAAVLPLGIVMPQDRGMAA